MPSQGMLEMVWRGWGGGGGYEEEKINVLSCQDPVLEISLHQEWLKCWS